ncbi:hypothetical protein E4U53_000942, partial [Claviceps sorghi]
MSEHVSRQSALAGPSTRTSTQTPSRTQTAAPRVLRLRGEHAAGRSVQWAEDVVDNEGLGRKSSK